MPDAFSPVSTRAALLGLRGAWLPHAALTLLVAERARTAVIRASASPASWQLTGKDEHGQPRRDHAHAYFLPFASRNDGLLDRVLVWAAGGLLPPTRRALYRLGDGARVEFRGRPPLQLELLDFGGEFEPSKLLGSARRWTSLTPFVAPRFTKRRRGGLIDTPEEQLARLCRVVLGRVPQDIRPTASLGQDWARFVQRRSRDRAPVRRWASGWQLVFDEPVTGPIALGINSHFGLGCFAAESVS